MILQQTASRVLHIDLEKESSTSIIFPQRDLHIGGSGLAAALYNQYGYSQLPATAPCQPIVFAIGPLTGFFPLMSKVVMGFRSPYTGEWTESHAGGRLALSIRFAGYDAIMITGKAKSLSAIVVGDDTAKVHDVHFLAGKDVFVTGRFMRRYGTLSSGHRSTIRIGAAGEKGVAFATTNVDSFRHFGRLGSGAALGAKNIKAVVVLGDNTFALPASKTYPKLYKDIYTDLTTTSMMRKYHDLGTAENLVPLNELKALPWRNLQSTSDAAVHNISGEYFAENLLLRQTACAGCPVGCIHIAMLREKFGEENEYIYKQVGYDYELIFSMGTMLGMENAHDILRIIDLGEKLGLDSMSAGVALAFATEALEKNIITTKETLCKLRFGFADAYLKGLEHIVAGTTDFWQALAKGTTHAAKIYKGEAFNCSLGQEMAGYATGENFFVAQTLGFRHSHLDVGAYSYDQTSKDRDIDKALDFFMQDEAQRCTLTSLVLCLFARKAYSVERCQEALACIGLQNEANNLQQAALLIQKQRWQLKFATGFVPEEAKIPKRFTEISTWKGTINSEYMLNLQKAYAKRLRELAGSSRFAP